MHPSLANDIFLFALSFPSQWWFHFAQVTPGATAVVGDRGVALAIPKGEAESGEGGVAVSIPAASAQTGFGGIAIAAGSASAVAGLNGVAVEVIDADRDEAGFVTAKVVERIQLKR